MAKRKVLTEAEKEIILQRWNYRCVGCHSTEDLRFHHIVPVSAGGGEWLENITVVCGKCHRGLHKIYNGRAVGGTRNGRKINPKVSNWKDAILAYCKGEIGTKEAHILLNASERTKLKDGKSKWFNDVLEENGISKFENQIDYYESTKTHRTLHDGDKVGHIWYADGTDKDCFYSQSQRDIWRRQIDEMIKANNAVEIANRKIKDIMKVTGHVI